MSEQGGEFVLLCVAEIDDDVRPTGATTHRAAEIIDGEVVPGDTLGPFAALGIARDIASEGYLLFYYALEKTVARPVLIGTPRATSMPPHKPPNERDDHGSGHPDDKPEDPDDQHEIGPGEAQEVAIPLALRLGLPSAAHAEDHPAEEA